ncbi:MEDS domain-containing protein [Bradyrhizobium stylosanthis]|uniref:histidine kinase n=1 Tax=Bradyrhizobium stylosanthis TaxID=1803665 RepID=A0A560DMR9_9BRAD|nr:MEDS domain-containing protein [Bradyrhizobium stylosanthis]TWA98411.1 two-component sensor histidine kinase [Bradyrhizobium stylosanthis]
MSDHAPTGLAGIDQLPWGTHLCQFFGGGDQLRETLVPYFKAGLENGERCLLVAMDPFGADDARSALRAAVGDFDRRELLKQIEIHDVRTWYAAGSRIDGVQIVEGLLRSEAQARADGYSGFRTNGNIGWVEPGQWADFQDYEARVTRGLKGRRMISMCSYCLDRCGPQEVLDVVCRHDFTIACEGNGWSAQATGRDETARLNESERHLSVLVRELEHRIKNNLATVQALAGFTVRRAGTLEEFEKSFTGRIAALSRTHSLLTDGAQGQVPLRQLVENELSIYADRDDGRLLVAGPDVDLPAQVAVSFGMAIHELTTNAVKHGALSARGGRLEVDWYRTGGDLQFEWSERDLRFIVEPARTGFGTQLLKRLLPHQLDARVELNFEPDGLKARIRLPL